MIRFFTFSQFHNKIPPAGSTHIRVMQLLKYWPEAGLYKYGENPEVMIFQKVYCTQDYQFPAHFPGIKILDMCDPDWLTGMFAVKQTIDHMDAVTVSSKGLRDFLKQLTDKPVIWVKDRFDVSVIPKPKEHKGRAKTVVWFGYRHNAVTLRPAMNMINELGLDLIVISDDDPMPWQWLPGETGERFRHTRYKYISHREQNLYFDLQRADFCLLPVGGRPIDPFKSNNKTIRAILAGIPVAQNRDDVKEFMEAVGRVEWMAKHYEPTIKDYDVQLSVRQYKRLIEVIKARRMDGST